MSWLCVGVGVGDPPPRVPRGLPYSRVPVAEESRLFGVCDCVSVPLPTFPNPPPRFPPHPKQAFAPWRLSLAPPAGLQPRPIMRCALPPPEASACSALSVNIDRVGTAGGEGWGGERGLLYKYIDQILFSGKAGWCHFIMVLVVVGGVQTGP